MDERTRKIAGLNDRLRTTFNPEAGKVFITPGIQGLPAEDQREIMQLVQTFTRFSDDNDPHAEHDFGSITYKSHDVFWKIDYYAPDMEHGSEDPSDPQQTLRVMTVMLAHEY